LSAAHRVDRLHPALAGRALFEQLIVPDRREIATGREGEAGRTPPPQMHGCALFVGVGYVFLILVLVLVLRERGVERREVQQIEWDAIPRRRRCTRLPGIVFE